MRLLFTGLICVFLLGLPASGRAASSIAVVDVLRILTHSDAAVSVQKQREALRGTFLEEISKTERDLSQEERVLAGEAADMPQEQYAKKRQAYEEKLNETRKLAQSRKHALDEASGAAMDNLREQLYLVVQEIANEKGYALVISNQNVIAGEKSLDITEETLRRLNQRVKEIPLKLAESPDKKPGGDQAVNPGKKPAKSKK